MANNFKSKLKENCGPEDFGIPKIWEERVENYVNWKLSLPAPEQSAIESLVRDAERYRWLRDSMDSPIVSEAQATDKMVDAAIAAQEVKHED